MKRILYLQHLVLLSVILLCSFCAYSQVAINTTGSNADASAMIDVSSTEKGMLIPRMTSTERDNINSPANGLMIYNTSNNGFEYFNGASWASVGGSSGGLTVTENISMDGNFLSGDGDNEGIFVDSLGNVGVGVDTPGVSAAIDLHAVDKALLLNRLTTAQRDNLTAEEGMIIFNSETGTFQGCNSVGLTSDQSNTNANSTAAINGTSSPINSAFGQSFTLSTTADLLQVEFFISAVTTSGSFNVRIYQGAGFSGTVLANEAITITNTGVLNVAFTSPPTLTGGTTYTIQLAETNWPGTPTADITLNYGGNLYVDGVLYATQDGATTSFSDFDLYFNAIISGTSWVDLH